MTLAALIERLRQTALAQPAVQTVVDADVFRLNAMPDVKYGVFAWQQQLHRVNVRNSFVTYAFTLFYIDRLTESGDNEVEVQSVGMSVLTNIIRAFADEMDVSDWSAQAFTQRFADLCAGVYAQVTFTVAADYTCEDNLLTIQ